MQCKVTSSDMYKISTLTFTMFTLDAIINNNNYINNVYVFIQLIVFLILPWEKIEYTKDIDESTNISDK